MGYEFMAVRLTAIIVLIIIIIKEKSRIPVTRKEKYNFPVSFEKMLRSKLVKSLNCHILC